METYLESSPAPGPEAPRWENHRLQLLPHQPVYPAALNGLRRPLVLRVHGRFPLPSHPRTALLVSAQAPAGILLAVHDLAQQWRSEKRLILSGFQAPAAQEALTVLLRGPQVQLVRCLSRGLPRRLPAAQQAALAAGRLTLLSPFADNVRRGSRETAVIRNRLVIALADQVLIPYARPGGSTEQLAAACRQRGKRLYTLAHVANRNLRELGAGLWGE
jgi:predicted Rossmann fold nucleotide-binding protein DprA/Smf involved in DNA uptake